MGGELAGRKHSVFLSSFDNPRFKTFRRLLQTGLNARAAKGYRPIQVQECQVLLQGLANSPEDFMAHIRRSAIAVILKVAYGYQVAGNDDPFVRNLQEGLKVYGGLSTPGKYWVEFFPVLRFVPAWFPGAGFKCLAQQVGQKLSFIEREPLERAKKEIAGGHYIESFVSKHLHTEDGQTIDADMEESLKWTSAALYVGGGETTVSTLITFFLLMAQYPEMQERAQAEIDQVAPDRLPTLEDYEALPYIVALIKEISRWAPVAPLAIPHRVMQDDVYDGYFIPKGTKIIANIWAMTRDETLYPDPETFDPTRHLGYKPQPDPFTFIFGFGRRICPGAHLAEMSLFLNICSILAIFDISEAIDANGNEVEPKVEWTSGITRNLRPFQCQIKPRSEESLLLLEKE
ncbi:unnamed protein product [Cyclocybe aegerita]|uniref:Cytochrome P450 n=1 Tax=Cyclocybe aegerita TaxID=1973307 RepID=A0A8S0W6P0_CYCAE|nr:unnamed protein product [Cyclocybe aegerita]